MTAHKKTADPKLSRLVLHKGFAWGWAYVPGHRKAGVHLYFDGKHVAGEVTGQSLPAAIERICGTPPHPHAGFCFALPAAAHDGFEHTIQVALPQVDEGLYGVVLTMPAKAIRGETVQRGRQLAGTVWFSSPSRAERLRITDSRGKLVYQQILKPLATAEAGGYPASFTVPINELGVGPFSLSCGGQQLRGSPINPIEFVVGNVERFERSFISGWAFNGLDFMKPIELVLRVDGKVVRWFRPNILRSDLQQQLSLPEEAMGIAGFHITPPALLFDGVPHLVEIAGGSSSLVLGDGQHWVTWPSNGRKYDVARLPAKSATASFPSPEVSVVILNRNGSKVLAGMLESWERYNLTVAAELIVIDHGSTDDSLALLKRWRKRLDLKVVALKQNDSFSASCNRGAQLARGRHLLFMNNDIQWLQDALPRMLESLQDPAVGMVGMKLLKVVGESQSEGLYASEVQHLGVRFTLNETGYWPYEIAPVPGIREEEYSPQTVPVVTGAVLLCRKSDFDAVGGFHTDYFYGFEDVELCLRLAARLGKRVVCRNDCVALHYHGHTRLSGRERSIFDRLQRNSTVLESHIGLWIKQVWWRSLLSGDGEFTREPLRIGLIGDAEELAASLAAVLPHASIVLLGPEDDWKNIQELHVLAVGDRRYDIRSLQSRVDLCTVAWIKDSATEWAALAWWQDFAAVAAPARIAASLQTTLKVKVHASNAATPLGSVLAADSTRLRVAIRSKTGDDACQRYAAKLQKALRKGGAACWLAAADGAPARVTDVCVTLVHKTAQRAPKVTVKHGTLQVSVALTQPLPTAEWLKSELEKQVGSTFQSP